MVLGTFFALASYVGCVPASQITVAYPLQANLAAGNDLQAISDETGTWTIALDEAKMAFGPLYFCSTTAASSDLCPSALQEFTDIAVIDLMALNTENSQPQTLGSIVGLSGVINSAMFDFGQPWLATDTNPRSRSPLDGGHTLVMQGTATRTDGATFRFDLGLDLQSNIRGEALVIGYRTQATFSDLLEEQSRIQLTASFSPAAWLADLDWQAIFDANQGNLADPNFVLHLEEDSSVINRLSAQMTAQNKPVFTWSFE